jgi:CheY-like chemotaxis protein
VGTPRILIVEDEFLIRMMLCEALGEAGFEVIEAATGDEALRALAAHPQLRLLLTDIQLPGGADGRAVARAAREAAPGLPVIYMTGRPDSLLATASPHDAVIAKPCLPSEVCALARQLTGL